ncbi:MAG: hypothetical protein IKF48_02550 [Oscillospiraceae bacterium]|nr:hypothetical protein [Oscillospiraceae bacterium]
MDQDHLIVFTGKKQVRIRTDRKFSEKYEKRQKTKMSGAFFRRSGRKNRKTGGGTRLSPPVFSDILLIFSGGLRYTLINILGEHRLCFPHSTPFPPQTGGDPPPGGKKNG